MRVTRVSISADPELFERFDKLSRSEGYPTRSEAMQALIRKALVERQWEEDAADVAGAVAIVYDHHRRGLAGRLVGVQHKFDKLILCVQHVHVDHDNCLEVLLVRGKASAIRQLVTALQSLKGLKHCDVVMTTTGQGV